MGKHQKCTAIASLTPITPSSCTSPHCSVSYFPLRFIAPTLQLSETTAIISVNFVNIYDLTLTFQNIYHHSSVNSDVTSYNHSIIEV